MAGAPTGSPGRERELLDAARGGDEHAFGRLVEPHRAALHAHCYRMLGSVQDAEDALQDALLRAWRGLPRFEGRSGPRAWLYRIATNVCIDACARRPRRVLPSDLGPPSRAGEGAEAPLAATVWIEPYPDERIGLESGYASPEARYEQREAVELAFIAALQHLPGRQRAVLILREVMGFSAREVAEMLGATTAAVNSALQRARRAVDERLPAASQQTTVRAIGHDGVREVVGRFIDAFEQGDVDAIVALLSEDVSFEMPPYETWFRGRDAVSDSWLMPEERPTGLRYLTTRANGQIAMGVYALRPERDAHVAIALDVLTLVDGAAIANVTAFRTPGVLAAFGLPAEVPRHG